jgi:hypothetical protein
LRTETKITLAFNQLRLNLNFCFEARSSARTLKPKNPIRNNNKIETRNENGERRLLIWQLASSLLIMTWDVKKKLTKDCCHIAESGVRIKPTPWIRIIKIPWYKKDKYGERRLFIWQLASFFCILLFFIFE